MLNERIKSEITILCNFEIVWFYAVYFVLARSTTLNNEMECCDLVKGFPVSPATVEPNQRSPTLSSSHTKTRWTDFFSCYPSAFENKCKHFHSRTNMKNGTEGIIKRDRLRIECPLFAQTQTTHFVCHYLCIT